jgi:hypothetical protein
MNTSPFHRVQNYEAVAYSFVMKEVSMTLPVALAGSDGILLASDTRQVENHLDEWSVQTMEEGDKVILNPQRTIAAAGEGWVRRESFVNAIVGVIGSRWGTRDGPLFGQI